MVKRFFLMIVPAIAILAGPRDVFVRPGAEPGNTAGATKEMAPAEMQADFDLIAPCARRGPPRTVSIFDQG